MKVLLAYPAPPRTHWPRGGFRSRWVPTGLMSLAGVLLRAGHRVRVHVREEHLMKVGFDWKQADALLERAIEEFRPDMVAMSVVTPALAEAQQIAAAAKRICGPQTIVAAGGPHASALPIQTLEECPDIDAAGVGEGEGTILELADHGLRKGIAGLARREKSGELIRPHQHRPVVEDLDSLPDTPYDLLDMSFYTERSRFMLRWMDVRATNIRTSRGCSHACRFCGGHLVSGVGVRTHSLDRVVSQVRQAVDEFGVEAIHFEDDTIGADAERLLEFCELLQGTFAKPFIWDCCLRVDQADGAVLTAMKAAGCVQVEYGFESGSDGPLRSLGKATTAELNRRAVARTREAGLRIFADIMVGLPGETEEDFQATVQFLRETRPEVVSAVRLCPLPGTSVYQQLAPEQRQRLKWADMTYFDLPDAPLNLSAMSDQRLNELWRKFSRYYARPLALKGMLRDSRSDDVASRRRLRRKWVSFCLRHPLAAMSLRGK